MNTLVLVADDERVVRSVRVALRYAKGCRVAATVDGRFAARASLCDLRPDVVLVDEMCQRTNAFARLREARQLAPGATVVLLCAAMEQTLVDGGLASGAHAVLPRGVHPAELGTRLRAVLERTAEYTAQPGSVHPFDAPARTSA